MQKKYLLIGLILLIIGGGLIFKLGFKPKPSGANPQPQIDNQTSSTEISIVSTKPDPLEHAVLLPTQVFEISFNQPIQNIGEFKHQLEPKFEYDAKLSPDRKTVIISPKNTYPLGQEMTLFIKGDTKFDQGKSLGKEIIYHLNTIQYRGV